MIHIPFTAYARIVPDRQHNKRRTYTKSIEKIAEFVAGDIIDYVDANPSAASVTINGVPRVLTTPQFAQFPARVTIVGWDSQNIDNFQPASRVTIDAPFTSAEDDNYEGIPGKTVEGYMATQYLHPQGQILTNQIKGLVQNLKVILETASFYLDDIYRIDYMGVTFGETGHSFP